MAHSCSPCAVKTKAVETLGVRGQVCLQSETPACATTAMLRPPSKTKTNSQKLLKFQDFNPSSLIPRFCYV